MALPTLPDGTLITETHWNAHVTEINRLLDKPHARYYQSSNIDLPDGNTELSFDTTVTSHPDVDLQGGNTVILNRPGVWVIQASVRFGGDPSGGERYGSIIGAGNNLAFDSLYPGDQPACVSLATTRSFSAGDSVQFRVYQNTGGTIPVEAVGFGEANHIAVTWLCP